MNKNKEKMSIDKKMSKGKKKYIRNQKMLIRKNNNSPVEAEKLIDIFVKNIYLNK